MKMLVEDRYDNIGAVIINSRKSIDLDLIDKSRKRIYKEMLKGNDDAKGDLDDNVIDMSIYVFSQIRYTKTKTCKRYIYIRQ